MASQDHINIENPTPLDTFLNQCTYKCILNAVKEYIPSRDDGPVKILDIGCGTGELLARLSERGYYVEGCDIDERCVKISSKTAHVEKIDLNSIEGHYAPQQFDWAVVSHVLEHIESPYAFLKQAMQVVKSGFIISVPNPYYLPQIMEALIRRKPKYVKPGHLYSWDWRHFKTFVEKHFPLRVEKFYHDTVSLPVPKVFRKLLLSMKALDFIENKVLLFIFPWFCRSITAVIVKK